MARTHQQVIRARAETEQMAELAERAREALAELDELDEVASERDAPMAALAHRVGLSAEQVELLWCIVACSVDGRLVPHLEAMGGGHARRGLSPAVYAAIAERDDDSISRLACWLAAPNALIDTGLVVATEPVSPAARAYVASPRLIGYLSGAADGAPLGPLRRLHAPDDVLYDDGQVKVLDELWRAIAHGRDAVIVVEGPLGSGRATAVASASSRDLIVLDLAQLEASQLEHGLIALQREGVLGTGLPVIANLDHLGEHPARRAIGACIDRLAGPVIVTTATPEIAIGTQRPIVRIAWDPGSAELRVALWGRAIAAAGARVDGELASLAHRYRVGPAAIARAVASVRWRDNTSNALGESALIAGLRHNIAEQMGGLAQRFEVTQTWDDLVIAEDTADLIAALVGRVRHAHQVLDQWGYRRKIARGTGVAALFSGPPGTGKTMVAGLIAKELDLELYQVDLSKVVSKWVGETEKNLAKIFDGAEQGHALLLFDEADSLFGQRSSESRGAADRAANLEVNYLLQRVEAFGGITVLTTNMDSAIDAALKRRLAAHIVFAAPDEDERERLWRAQSTTGRSPLSRDVDARELARGFPAMSGAHIRNAAISAAFLAAAEGASQITHEHLTRAARAEYRSMGHMVSESIVSRTQNGRR